MDPIHWKTIEAVDPDKFAKARHQVHSAVQWLARMATSYSGEQASNLLWDAERRVIATQPLAGQLGMELRLPELILQFTEHSVPVRHDFETEGHTQAHIEAWILVELLHRGIDRDRFSKALPYDVSGLMTGDVVEFSPEAYTAELEALAGSYENAGSVMAAAALGKSQIWPQDLALEYTGATVRAGFSPGLPPSGRPGFYVTPVADARDLPLQSTLTIEALPPGQAGATTAAEFLHRAVDAARAPS